MLLVSRPPDCPGLCGWFGFLCYSASKLNAFVARHVPGLQNEVADALVFRGSVSSSWHLRLGETMPQWL